MLASYATTSAVTAAIATSASASYLDAVAFTNTQVATKQDSLQWLAATGTAFINPTDLNVRKIQANPPLSINLVDSSRSILLHADCYSKSDSDSRYIRTDAHTTFAVVHSNGQTLKMHCTSSKPELRFGGGAVRVRRISGMLRPKDSLWKTVSDHLFFVVSSGLTVGGIFCV